MTTLANLKRCPHCKSADLISQGGGKMFCVPCGKISDVEECDPLLVAEKAKKASHDRMMSAAPELLLALERITNRMNRWLSHGIQAGPKGIDHDYAGLYNYARAVIRKAKGE
jgi:hypothetical protein